jgi:hypothetical protein
MTTPNQHQHRGECRLYKAIAHVFDGRIDLTDRQKADLIHLCYDAAKKEEKLTVDCAVGEALSAAHEQVPLVKASFGRRTFP